MVNRKNFDWLLIFTPFLIIFLGTVTIFSVNQPLFLTHLFYSLVALAIFLIISWVDVTVWESFAFVGYILTFLLLLTPIFFGVLSRGAVRWVQIGSFTFQPSEFAKPLMLIFFAKFLAENKTFPSNVLKSLIFLVPPTIMIFLQPDLGSSLAVVSLVAGIIFASEIKWKEIFLLILFLLFVLPFGWLFLKPFQKERIIHFINPSSDPLGSGYNVLQSIITIGSGGLVGKGLGKGTQSHLSFLPERHTDFIFSSFAEEFGLLGCLFLIFLYTVLFRRILEVARLAPNDFSRNLCIGVFSFLFFQAMVNIGMNLGIMPVTGITLPLFSFGGNSLVSCLISLGMVENISSSLGKKAKFEIGTRQELR